MKMKIKHERGTDWITVDGSSWARNGYSKTYVDTFGDVWLKPYFNAPNVYVTVLDPPLYFSIEDGSLVEE